MIWITWTTATTSLMIILNTKACLNSSKTCTEEECITYRWSIPELVLAKFLVLILLTMKVSNSAFSLKILLEHPSLERYSTIFHTNNTFKKQILGLELEEHRLARLHQPLHRRLLDTHAQIPTRRGPLWWRLDRHERTVQLPLRFFRWLSQVQSGKSPILTASRRRQIMLQNPLHERRSRCRPTLRRPQFVRIDRGHDHKFVSFSVGSSEMIQL